VREGANEMMPCEQRSKKIELMNIKLLVFNQVEGFILFGKIEKDELMRIPIRGILIEKE